jgi:gluconolactonase
MNISIPFLTFSWGWNAFFQSSGYGISQSHYVPLNVTISHDYEALFLNNVPPGFVNVSCLFVKENLAVIPGDWKAGDISELPYG